MKQYALVATNEIFQKSQFAVMVGGTGLYIKAFCEGLDEVPAIDPIIRKNILDEYAQHGLSWLQQQVQEKDPVFWQIAEQQNPQRLMRALEVYLSTKKSVIHFRTKTIKERPFGIIKLCLNIPKENLYKNIEHRVDEMIKNGLAEEVKSLLPFKELNALQTVGYTELVSFYEHQKSFDNAVNSIKINTRHYAKRQITWFKKDLSMQWISPEIIKDFLVYISSVIDK